MTEGWASLTKPRDNDHDFILSCLPVHHTDALYHTSSERQDCPSSSTDRPQRGAKQAQLPTDVVKQFQFSLFCPLQLIRPACRVADGNTRSEIGSNFPPLSLLSFSVIILDLILPTVQFYSQSRHRIREVRKKDEKLSENTQNTENDEKQRKEN